MRYRVKTMPGADGKPKFLIRRQGNKTSYYVKAEDGREGWVDRKWVVKNLKYIENVGMSGNYLYPLVNSKFDTKGNTRRDTKQIKEIAACSPEQAALKRKDEEQFNAYLENAANREKMYEFIDYSSKMKLYLVRDPQSRYIICTESDIRRIGERLIDGSKLVKRKEYWEQAYYSYFAMYAFVRSRLKMKLKGIPYSNYEFYSVPDYWATGRQWSLPLDEPHTAFNASPGYCIYLPIKKGQDQILLNMSPKDIFGTIHSYCPWVFPSRIIGASNNIVVYESSHVDIHPTRAIKRSGEGYTDRQQSVQIIVGKHIIAICVILGVRGKGYAEDPCMFYSLYSASQMKKILSSI